ncbi:hypothetical protein FK85_24870 [Halorubrum saccharovorum]|uniref:Uncharacterized protein n=1 Tax=Halorubrum saccharovorum TaxID=2248 RepID=A0A0F8D6I0_9EURY|nr:hypothetical protein [Halorubrum saccharovorum]KKF39904.1 hypothetical protein FK85_24870 [Halorubrum saccharovorum]
MAVPQLTLYDFLADFLPGAVALGLLGSLLWLSGILESLLTTYTGILIVVTSYPVGRGIHAVAGQIEVKKLRKRTFDNFVFALENTRLNTNWLAEDVAVDTEPKVVDRLKNTKSGESSDDPQFNDWVDQQVAKATTGSEQNENSVTKDDLRNPWKNISKADIDWGEQSWGQFQRFGFTELFDMSTLYQRYNILETFYRNLWLVSTYFSIIFLITGFTEAIAPKPFWFQLSIIAVGVWILFWTAGFRPILWAIGIGAISVLIFVLYSWVDFEIPLDVSLTVNGAILFTSFALIATLVYATRQFVNNDKSSNESLPWWYILLGLLVCLIIFVLPVTLLFRQMSQTAGRSAALFAGTGLILFMLSVLFDVRRIQFKDRQVRAFINDIYRQQQSTQDME